MNSKTTLSISEARKKIFQIARDVQHPNKVYTLTDKGAPKAVIMSAEEFESWMETLEVADMFPDLKKDLKKLKSDIKANRLNRYRSLDDVLASMGA